MSDRETGFGAEAYTALASVVRELKVEDPLRLVTVLVPSEHVGVVARRALARGEGRPGVAALRLVTLRRLAESLAAAELVTAGRRPLTTTALAGTVRDALADDAGLFGPVKEQIGTVRALAEAHRALRTVPDPESIVVGVPVAEDTVRLHRGIEHRVASTSYDEADLLRGAAQYSGTVEGPVVAFLLHDLDPAEQTLLDTLPDLHTISGDTSTAPGIDRVLSASDPEEEVRAAVREVMAALRQGVPGHRIAVFYGSASPYARLLHDHLRRAEVTFFGRGTRSTLDNPLGRGLLRMLALPDHDLRRDEVLAWIADAPVRHGDRRAPSSRWDRASRAAGVATGRDWDRLHAYAEQRADRDPRAATAARELLAFVDELRALLDTLDAATSWAEVAANARALWDATLAPPDDDLRPDDDRAAHQIVAALSAVGRLPGNGTRRALRELLELQLADDLDRVGTVGVHVGAIGDGVGACVERVIVVGAAEGVLPSRPADDPLLPDRVRTRTGGVLPTMPERVARQRRDFHAALAAAPPGGRTVSYPRGDLRGGGTRVPSRWLGDTSATVELPSYTGAVLTTAPTTPQEWHQRAVTAGVATDPLTDALRAAGTARRSPAFTVHAGNLHGADLPDPTTGRPVSPSALESWARCPWGYFVGNLLGARPVEQPEDVVRVSAATRGTLLHAALEGLVTEARAGGWAPGPDESWPAQSREVLERHARIAFTRAEAEGLTGRPLLWEQDSAALLGDLRQWLARDDERRARLGGLTPLEEEWSFGGPDEPTVSIDLGDGRELHLRGTVDRIDADAEGRLVVTDYKTGRRRAPKKDEAEWDGGRRLQLPLYALAAAEHFAHPSDEPLRAAYWYTSRREGFAEVATTIDDTARDAAIATVAAVVDGIVGGVFPSRATTEGAYYQGRPTSFVSCHTCDPDGLGERIHPSWDQLASSPELQALPTVHRLLFGAEEPA